MTLGCDLLQGYYFSPPIGPEEAGECIRDGLSVADLLAFLSAAGRRPGLRREWKRCVALPILEFPQSAAAGFD